MNDDLNTPVVLSHLFDSTRIINQALDKKITLTESNISELRNIFNTFLFEILGMRIETGNGSERENIFGKVVDMLLERRSVAKANKDWATSDSIRNSLTALGFEIKDNKEGSTWKLNK